MSARTQLRAAAWQFLRERWRDRRLPVVVSLLLILSSAALAASALSTHEYERHRLAAQQTERVTWRSQGARNPHTVAHFSRFAFKQTQPAMLLDAGLSDYLGSAIWLEAHWQRPANFRAADDRVDLGRFADLHLAWVWQVLGALAIIVLGFDAVAGERERGTLALLAGNGISLRRLIAGKAWGLVLLMGGTLLIAFLLAQTLAIALFPTLTADNWLRAILWLLMHSAYLATVVTVVVAVSVRARCARSALAWLLMIWVCCGLLLPRVAANVAERVQPLPSAAEFWLHVSHDLENGIDGDDPAVARAKALEARTLAQYGVSSVAQLPVSYAAISLQADEEYGNRVFDSRFGALQRGYFDQGRLQLAFGVLSPVIALQVNSAGVAGSDMPHHLEFTRQAEAQRRVLIKQLNEEMIEHGAGRDFQYLARADFWQTLPEVQIQTGSIKNMVPRYAASSLMTLAWLVGAVLLLKGSSGGLNRESRHSFSR